MTFLQETPFLIFLWGTRKKKKDTINLSPPWWPIAVEDEPQWQIVVYNKDKDEIAQSRDKS